MKKTSILFASIAFLSWHIVLAQTPTVSIVPEQPLQGDPLMVVINDISGTSVLKNITFDAQPIPFFLYHNLPTAFIGTDLNVSSGNHTLVITFHDKTAITQAITLHPRKKDILPLGIPEKLGGNTTTSQKKLVTSLKKSNTILQNLATNKKKIWSDDFIFPVANPVVVDPYGYTRETGTYTIAHKGTDFKAPIGTEVNAMNRGVVRFANYDPIYGNMVVLDHGLGLMTFYMHLSKLKVKTGQLVQRGHVIGLSGDTGYALGPHLHISVHINKASIDPMVFMGFFK